jgi:hypothetical protein
VQNDSEDLRLDKRLAACIKTVRDRKPMSSHMSENKSQPPGHGVGYRWIWLVAAIGIFGVLMGLRGDFHSVWIRAILAGCAFAILFGTISWLRKAPR